MKQFISCRLNVGSDNGAAFVAAATKNWNAQCKLVSALTILFLFLQ